MSLEKIINGIKKAACVGLVTLALAGGVKEARAKTYYVNSENEEGPTIQSVINDCNDGDEIIVAEGRYYENINFNGKNIVLRSTNPNDPNIVATTIIDGFQSGSVVTFENGEDANCVLSGFTITNGYANWGTFYWGGGVYCSGSSPNIANCMFTANSAHAGGGMCNYKSSPTLSKCIFSGNSAKWFGGGMWNWGSSSTLTNCIFTGNSAGSGGAICVSQCSPVITNSTFSDNYASYNYPWSVGGISFEVPAGGYKRGDVVLTNCILWANKNHEGMNESAQIYRDTPVVNYCCIQGWTGALGGIGNIGADPLFVDPNSNDYHLKSQAGRYDPNTKTWVKDNVTSRCIDTGDPHSPIGLEPFPNGGIINMGAYGGTAEASKSYFGEPVCETIVAGDINGDCIVDFKDFAFLAFHWLEQHQ